MNNSCLFYSPVRYWSVLYNYVQIFNINGKKIFLAVLFRNMKVNKISNNNTYRQNFNSRFKSPLDIEDTYDILKYTVWRGYDEIFPKKYGKKASLLLNLIKNMTGIDYLNLTPKQRGILDKVVPPELERDVKINFDIVRSLKSYMDVFFGDFKNYTILSIGRSLATCCETLKHMGADIKFLPMSDLRKYNSFSGLTSQGVSAYGKYLSSIGLTKEQIINNPTHKYIIMDFTCTGNSLRNAHEFLTWDELLSNAPNIETLSTEESLDFIHNGMLSGQSLKKYSGVLQLNPREFEDVFKAADPYKYDYRHYRDSSDHIMTKLFRLKMFEHLDNNNELKSLL